MKFKTLKHKTLLDTFGRIIEVSMELPSKQQHEIGEGDIPLLQPMTATMELMVEYWKGHGMKLVLEQSEQYELVEVEVNIVIPGEYEYGVIEKVIHTG